MPNTSSSVSDKNSSSSSGTSYTTASTLSMPRAKFAQSEADIRNFYRQSLSSEFNSLPLFVHDHIQKARQHNNNINNQLATSSTTKFLTDIAGKKSTTAPPQQISEHEGEEEKQGPQSAPSRFTKFTEMSITLLTEVFYESLNNEPALFGSNFHLASIDHLDLQKILSICMRTIFLLVLVNGSLKEDFSSSPSCEDENENNSSKKKNKKNKKNFWFSYLAKTKKRKLEKVTQVRSVAFLAKQIVDGSFNLRQQEEEDGEREEASAKSTSKNRDIPDCSEIIEKLLETHFSSGGENLDCLRRALRLVIFTEALSSTEFFWGKGDGDNSPSAKNNSTNHPHHETKRRGRTEDQEEEQEEEQDKERVEDTSFIDTNGTKWNSSLRYSCGLLGGFYQLTKGIIAQTQYEINRANEKFDLVPAPVNPLSHPPGWVSRFDSIEGKFWVMNKTNRNYSSFPTFWSHICVDLKSVGIKERLIRTVGWTSDDDNNDKENATSADETKLEQRRNVEEYGNDNKNGERKVVKFNEEKNELIAGNERTNEKDQMSDDAIDDIDANDPGTNTATTTPAISRSKPLPATKTLHTKEDLEKRAHAALPTILSRLVNDQSQAHHQVHSSYERIMKLIGELKTEISNFSSSAEVSNTLDELAPKFVDSAKKDLVMMKNFSDILLTASAVAVSAPEFIFGWDSREWERRVFKFFDEHTRRVKSD